MRASPSRFGGSDGTYDYLMFSNLGKSLVKVKQEGKVAGEGKLLGNPIDTATMNDVVVSKDNLTPFVKINL